MGYVLSAVARVLEQPTAWGAAREMALLVGLLWVAAVLGIIATADPPQFATVDFWKSQRPARLRAPLDYYSGTTTTEQVAEEEASLQGLSEMANKELEMGKDDLVNLWRLVEGNDGGPSWIKMMEKALPTYTYQAWRRDTQTRPPQYQSSTIFKNATPDEVRDFFGDDEFRMSR